MKNTRRGFLSFLAAIPAAFGVKAVADTRSDGNMENLYKDLWENEPSGPFPMSGEGMLLRSNGNCVSWQHIHCTCDAAHMHRIIGTYCTNCGKTIGG